MIPFGAVVMVGTRIGTIVSTSEKCYGVKFSNGEVEYSRHALVAATK